MEDNPFKSPDTHSSPEPMAARRRGNSHEVVHEHHSIFVWSGRGILAGLFGVGGPAVFLLPAFFIPESSQFFVIILAMAFPVGWLTAGTLCWRIGRSWNRETPVHSFYWIRMEYWGLCYLVLGSVLLVFIAVCAVIALSKG